MPATRLSSLDASFLAAETQTAHMHVGWASAFDPPADGRRPSFSELRDHIASRLHRAPRYRQRLASVPLGVHDPVWVDDERFDINRHVMRARSTSLGAIVDSAMSTQLERSRPLWECWVQPRLDDGRIGVVGKVHHCMVDGLGAVEIATVLLDLTAEPPDEEPDDWSPEPAPGALSRLAEGAVDRARQELSLFGLPARLLASPSKLQRVPGEVRRAIDSVVHTFGGPARPNDALNPDISPLRHLARIGRPVDDLVRIKSHFGATLNDVVLAVCSGGVRRFLEERGEESMALKAMVPVAMRSAEQADALGNSLSFLFMELPTDEPDPVRRLREINRATVARKRSGEAQGGDAVLKAASYTPHLVQRAITRVIAHPRTFNLVVSNIPGPRVPMWMMGCELRESYPVVPLAERHAVSIGVTTVRDGAYFGIYADRKALPDADVLARAVNDAIDELLELCPREQPPSNGGRRRNGSKRQARANGRPQPQPV